MTDPVDEWVAADPDPLTRAEIEALVAAGDDAALAERFGGRLTFGTAGLRGALGGGPTRMNRVVVRQAAHGLMGHLGEGSTVVIGYDARQNSDVFASDTAAIVAAHGGRALCFANVVPTPLLAFAVRHLGAAAGVMVTASHNPPGDNGYKVYLGDGAQLVPPHDAAIERAIVAVGIPPRQLPEPRSGGRVELLGDEVAEAYLDLALPPVHADLGAVRTVYTPLHGVGAALFGRALDRVGGAVVTVDDQARPDGSFPTVSFPNPEEPGALDRAFALASAESADLVLAHDPDADRLGVAVPDGAGWRALTGNEIGWLLADHVLSTTTGPDRLVVTTVVSSSLLAALAADHGVHYARTLTGFKWIMHAAGDEPGRRLVFGYEEALGYAVGDVVRDKDGITAAIAFLDLAAGLASEGRTVVDRLDDLARRYGRHLTGVVTLRTGDAAAAAELVGRLRDDPPADIAGRAVVSITDFLGDTGLPPTDLLGFDLAGGARLMVRPSGTEPKVKLYLELIADAGDDEAAGAFERLSAAAAALL